MLACRVEHAIEVISIAAGAATTGSSCKEILDSADFEIAKNSKDPVGAAELFRSFLRSEKYAQWANNDRLCGNAVRLLGECVKVQRRDFGTYADIADVVQWWRGR